MPIDAIENDQPIHPMIVAFPFTFYTASIVAFAIFDWLHKNPFWYRLGHFCTLAGIAMTVLAASHRSFRPQDLMMPVRGFVHRALSVSALLIFAVSALLQRGSWDRVPESVGSPFWLSLIGLLLTIADSALIFPLHKRFEFLAGTQRATC